MPDPSPHSLPHQTHDERMDHRPDAPYVRPEMTRSQELHVESHTRYGLVWVFLAAFTLIEYVWAHIFADAFAVLVLGLMAWAIIKAGAVGWYFMHLKFEGKWVYGFLIPAGILAIIMTTALIPDVGTQPITDEGPEEEESGAVSLLAPGDAPPAIVSRAS